MENVYAEFVPEVAGEIFTDQLVPPRTKICEGYELVPGGRISSYHPQ